MHRWAFLPLLAVLSALPTREAAAWRPGTAQSAELHGLAHLIRNKGKAALSRSKARINNEEARSKYIDNQKKWTATYFAKKEINQKYVDNQSAKAQAQRNHYLQYRGSQASPRLSLSQFDPTTGEISWPDGLKTKEFSTSRKKVEELFSLRANAQAAPGIVSDIRSAIETMRADLRKNIDKIDSSEYIAARKLLDGLMHEATLPSG